MLVVGAILAVTGCGGAEQAALYRAEKLLYEARKAETEVRLSNAHPDSITLLRVRAEYLKVRESSPGPYKIEGDLHSRVRTISMIRTIGAGEASGVRLALEAKRADLALATAERLQVEAASDTSTSRQAAFMAVAAYQGLRRYEDAIAQMKKILTLYRPMPPPPKGEDPVIVIPEAIVNLRRNLGDEEGAAREMRFAVDYYQRELEKTPYRAVEAQLRARLLRTYLELSQVGRALEETNKLERLIMATPSLRSMLAEVAFAKGKIKATIDKDPGDGIAILDRIATDFPDSPFAPRGLFEAGTHLEKVGNLRGAQERYESILQRFPAAPEVAALSLYRLAMVHEKMGDWGKAKVTFESVPVRYPRSSAAAEAPVAVIQHYMREGQKSAAQRYFSKALITYRGLIARDSSGELAPLFRVKMFQIYAAGRDSNGVYKITEEMLQNDPKHPYTAQILLQAARFAKEFGNVPRGLAYLRRFLQDFPRSPVVADVRREIKEHGG
jgi:tetratricopeptide (TPR) repeat protein